MIDIKIVLALVFLHFIADFVLQSDEVAKNKSKRNSYLVEHVLIYGIPFIIFGWKFFLANIVLHFIVDYVTSRITSKLWEKGETHWFFVTIGFDQMIHISTLIITYKVLV